MADSVPQENSLSIRFAVADHKKSEVDNFNGILKNGLINSIKPFTSSGFNNFEEKENMMFKHSTLANGSASHSVFINDAFVNFKFSFMNTSGLESIVRVARHMIYVSKSKEGIIKTYLENKYGKDFNSSATHNAINIDNLYHKFDSTEPAGSVNDNNDLRINPEKTKIIKIERKLVGNNYVLLSIVFDIEEGDFLHAEALIVSNSYVFGWEDNNNVDFKVYVRTLPFEDDHKKFILTNHIFDYAYSHANSGMRMRDSVIYLMSKDIDLQSDPPQGNLITVDAHEMDRRYLEEIVSMTNFDHTYFDDYELNGNYSGEEEDNYYEEEDDE